jgi:WD40 repeat protein
MIGPRIEEKRIAFDQAGRLFAGAAEDGLVRIWDAHSWQLLRTIPAHIDYQALYLTFWQSRWLLTSDGNTAKVWDPETGQLLFELPHYNGAIRFADSGNFVVAFFQRDSLDLVAVPQVKKVRSFHAEQVPMVGFLTGFAVDLRSRLVAAGSKDGGLHVWNIGSEKSSSDIKRHTAGITAVEFDPSGEKIIAADESGAVLVHQLETFYLGYKLKAPSLTLRRAADSAPY